MLSQTHPQVRAISRRLQRQLRRKPNGELLALRERAAELRFLADQARQRLALIPGSISPDQVVRLDGIAKRATEAFYVMARQSKPDGATPEIAALFSGDSDG